MNYITAADYAAYCGESIPEEEFERYAMRASEAVDAATGYRIARAGLSAFDEFDRGQIILAVCAQCEALYLGGIENALGDSAARGAYYSIGKASIMSYGGGQSGGGSTVGLCAKATQALFPTGILYAGVCAR